MKKTLKLVATALLSLTFLVSPLCGYEKAQAYSLADYGLSYSDADSSGVNYLKDSGLAVYASRGITATSGERFKTVGVTVVCDDTGESKSFRDGDGIFSKVDEKVGGYTYTASIVNMQKAFDSGYFPRAKARYDSNRRIRFHLDSIMITTIKGYHNGDIDSDGNCSYGTVYYDAYSIWSVHSDLSSWGSLNDFDTYFNKEFQVWNGKAQLPDTKPYVRGMSGLKG